MLQQSVPFPNVNLQLRFSPSLLLFFTVLYGATLVVVIYSNLPWYVICFIILGSTTHATTSIRLHALRNSPHAIVALWQQSVGQWGLRPSHGRLLYGRLCHDSVITPWLVILNFRLTGEMKMRSVLITPDALEAEALRRLRVHLRQGEQ